MSTIVSKTYGLKNRLSEATLAVSQAIDNGLHGQAVAAMAEVYRTLNDLGQVYIDIVPEAHEELMAEVRKLPPLVKKPLPDRLDNAKPTKK